MNVNGRANEFVNAWTQSQKQMWESWRTFAQSMPLGVPPHYEVADQWQKSAQEAFDAWNSAANSTSQETAHRLLTSQQAFTNFLGLAAQGWSEIAAKLATNEDWQQTLNQYIEQLRSQLTRIPTSMAEANGNVDELWQAYQKQMQHLIQPWLQLWRPGVLMKDMPFANGASSPTGAVPDLMIPMMNVWGDALDRTFDAFNQTFGGLLDSPPLGYWREAEEKLRQSFKAWVEFNQATVEYQLMMAEAQVNVLRMLQEELIVRGQRGEVITTLDGIAALWSEIADPAFYEIFISDKFVRTQGKLLSATMNHRIQQRKLVEMACQQLDIPTRTEVDETHRSAYHQRKEIKALKAALHETTAQIRALQAAVDRLSTAAATAPTPSPRKSTATKRTNSGTPKEGSKS